MELRNAAVGAEVDWAGQVYYRGGRVENCGEGLRLSREHLYLQDLTFRHCRIGVFADSLLHTHWDHLVFGHGGPDSTAARTPARGGPHLQESRLVQPAAVVDDLAVDVRYLGDTQVSGWRFKAIDYEGVRAAYSGMAELSSCRLLDCGAAPSGDFPAVRLTASGRLGGWRIHDNLARDTKRVPTMKYGFDLWGLPDAADGVVGHGNHVHNPAVAG